MQPCLADRSGREQAILAHVLAHGIGHVLQRTNQHARSWEDPE
jgi:predicted HD phosphohydrolase